MLRGRATNVEWACAYAIGMLISDYMKEQTQDEKEIEQRRATIRKLDIALIAIGLVAMVVLAVEVFASVV